MNSSARRLFNFSRPMLLGVALAGAALSSGCTQRQVTETLPPPQQVDEVASFKPVQPERWKLSNGLTVMYLRDDELPVVRGRLFTRGGSLWGPETPRGIVGAMGDLMRQGGAGDLKADALDAELEKLAASVHTAVGAEFGSGSFTCLASDFNRVFDIFSKVVLTPRFEADRISLWKGQSIEAIRRRIEDPGTVASIAFTQLMYGPTPYGRVTTEPDIVAITRPQLVDLHRSMIRPDGAILTVTGRISRAEVERAVEEFFGSWQPRGTLLPSAPPVNYSPKPGIYFVTLPFQQASVQIGQLGVPRLTPDYPSIDVFNEVFGASGFGSRLMKRVRTELGLAYSVYGGIVPGVVKGVNVIFLQTKASSVGQAATEAVGVLEGLQKSEPQNEELIEKKAAIKNSFVFNFDSTDNIIARQARLELLQYPADYDQTYIDKIEGVQPVNVTTVARDRWQPSQFVVVVVGNESAYSDLQTTLAQNKGPFRGLEIQKLRFDGALVMQ